MSGRQSRLLYSDDRLCNTCSQDIFSLPVQGGGQGCGQGAPHGGGQGLEKEQKSFTFSLFGRKISLSYSQLNLEIIFNL